ncbi:hypothetical protein CHCC14600_1702 [Bacillus licheniformis]|nr:hypothetical protein B4164_1200 [Bacillus licheniformis]TWN17643.1 hypothetical protein CHCC14564_2208 [Bacillus licheniformis LMG 17339]TWK00754.1 hypothetical protein CHCC20487_4469 [Bacillus licheniformis]TWK61258.1 hypothetical protein CHCC20344_2555 [Bacillus licheniformis]TWK91002.1 hypothetical protein CHCC20327_2379 [Bacillus licheniformis]
MLNISCMPTPPLYQHMKKGEAGAGFHKICQRGGPRDGNE